MVVPRALQSDIVSTLRRVHPYEEPAFDLVPMVELPGDGGTGRVGVLPHPLTLAEFARHAAAVLPATAWGVRAAGSPDQIVETVAVCGGAGGGFIEAARAAGADVYLTADLKHHQSSEAVAERDGLTLVDAAHWATEQPFLRVLAQRLRDQFGTTVEVTVSEQVTDPWSLHIPSSESSLSPL
jgi:putative NIF3 family GTP cyclohydrolase 1 type 2